MGIKQMKRDDFGQPEVKTTEYGATFVKASVESKVVEPVVVEPEKEEEVPVEAPVEAEPTKKPAKSKGGRPKKK